MEDGALEPPPEQPATSPVAEDSVEITVAFDSYPTEELERKWKCKQCPSSFDRPSTLTLHTYTHTGEKRVSISIYLLSHDTFMMPPHSLCL